MAAERVSPFAPHAYIKLHRPEAGKAQDSPGDKRRELIDGKVYLVRAWDTFAAEEDAFRRTGRGGRVMNANTIEEVEAED
jgi:hypothetical protein